MPVSNFRQALYPPLLLFYIVYSYYPEAVTALCLFATSSFALCVPIT